MNTAFFGNKPHDIHVRKSFDRHPRKVRSRGAACIRRSITAFFLQTSVAYTRTSARLSPRSQCCRDASSRFYPVCIFLRVTAVGFDLWISPPARAYNRSTSATITWFEVPQTCCCCRSFHVPCKSISKERKENFETIDIRCE